MFAFAVYLFVGYAVWVIFGLTFDGLFDSAWFALDLCWLLSLMVGFYLVSASLCCLVLITLVLCYYFILIVLGVLMYRGFRFGWFVVSYLIVLRTLG